MPFLDAGAHAGFMTTLHILQLIFFFAVLLGLGLPLGRMMATALEGEAPPRGLGWMGRLERLFYAGGGIDPRSSMNWRQYLGALIGFHALGGLLLFLILRFQNFLPFNPQGLANVEWSLALNTAISFVTNTNWQAYSGESTLSYFSQFAGLTVQNFLSAAVGISVLAALARGLRNKESDKLGNFWADMVRSCVYVLLPLSIVMAFLLVGQGVVQSFAAYLDASTLEGATQTLPFGPAASQIAIKQLGTNGGGFFGVNSAHPFENPTPFSNFLQMLAILLIPLACVEMFGRMLNQKKHARALLVAMFVIFVPVLIIALYAEFQPNTALAGLPFIEGKEIRFGILNSTLWSQVTTAASNGSVNAMHDSLSPLAGGLAIFNMLLGEIVFGGVGSGLYGMVLFAILTVFLAGLMVGRTPEYLGKKIQAPEVRLAAVGIILPSAVVLLGSALSVLHPSGLAGLANQGPHGLSEILYAWASAANNNGSAFAGLTVNTTFYNLLLGVAMIIGRFGVMIPVIAVAGSLAKRKIAPPSSGTFPSEGPLFVSLLVGVILIVGALTFFPVLSLGPVVEHLLLGSGISF
jgi:potassium-transporting ATPase potassium-binding subunit